MGRTPDIQSGSLVLLQECLAALGFAEEDAKNLVAPLKEARRYRTKVKGHASDREGLDIKKQVLNKYREFMHHFRTLCQRCDESIRSIAEAFKQMK